MRGTEISLVFHGKDVKHFSKSIYSSDYSSSSASLTDYDAISSNIHGSLDSQVLDPGFPLFYHNLKSIFCRP